MRRWPCLLLFAALAARAQTAPTQPPLSALWGLTGELSLRSGSQVIGTVGAGLFEAGWAYKGAAPDRGANLPAPQRGLRIAGSAGPVNIAATAEQAAGGLTARYTFTPTAPLRVNSVHVSLRLPGTVWRGGSFGAAGRTGSIPLDFKNVSLASGNFQTLELATPGGLRLAVKATGGNNLLLQDDRQWGDGFSVRAEQSGDAFTFNQPLTLSLTITTEPAMSLKIEEPVTLAAGPEWVPFTDPLDIVPGSALDFRSLGLQDAPAGRHGWLRVTPDGHLAFERQPDRRVRLYGVNVCFSANVPDHALADRVADRLAALGYNTLRIHHYERDLVAQGAADSLTFNPDALDRFDYFVAALKKRGLYLTTDLYVSRPVRPGEVYAEGGEAGEYKLQVLLNPRARENLKEFCRRLFGRVNPYTGLPLATDPALPLLSLINEGNALNYLGGLKGRQRAEFTAAWNQWLTRRYATRAALAAAWGSELAADEDAAGGKVALRGERGARQRDLTLYVAELHRDLLADLRRFLRDELHCQALLTDLNAWTERWPLMDVRADMDYVDNHSYWDHPVFLERDWSLPSKGWSGGGSAVAGGVPLHLDKALTRLADKPFGFSEFNYSAPNAFRGESGPLTGGYGALHGWDAIWRFAYSHSRDSMAEARAGNYFDLATDPSTLAADRFAALLFLRDASPARNSVVVTATRDELRQGGTLDMNLKLKSLGLICRVATRVDGQPQPGETTVKLGQNPTAAEVLQQLRQAGRLPADHASDPGRGLWVSDNGELRLDTSAATFSFVTARSVGLFSARGDAPASAGPLRIEPTVGPVGVYAASLSAAPLATAPRLLLAHVPDVQNTGRRFADTARLTLLAWGQMPYLAQALRTRVTLALTNPAGLQLYALAGDGSRLGEVACQTTTGLAFDAVTRYGERAVIYYEVVRP
ncbi:MAG: hypothetical protein IT204_24135 [Fimbriimonadaceae bacterium]|nr:hypothetical protein [Fimbriimonadaceae bacterium]